MISERDIHRFMNGNCHLLAHAIHKLTGWPIHCLTVAGRWDLHAFVVAPDGRALDVRGWHWPGDLVGEFGADGHEQAEWPRLLIESEARRVRIAGERAREVAVELLREH